MSDETDHDLLIEMRGDIKHLILGQTEMKNELYGEKGICSRIRCLEDNQNRWLGRDGAIVAGISFAVSLLIAGIIKLRG